MARGCVTTSSTPVFRTLIHNDFFAVLISEVFFLTFALKRRYS